MDRVFVYWDNSICFPHSKRNASLSNATKVSGTTRYRVRINFENILRLAHADRPLERASSRPVPSRPELRHLWNRLDRPRRGRGVV